MVQKVAAALDTPPPMLYNDVVRKVPLVSIILTPKPPSSCNYPEVFHLRLPKLIVNARLATPIKAMNNSRFVMRITSR